MIYPTQQRLMTTSWDDGHPLDGKVADLLDRYGLKGTFYVPRYNSEGRPVLQEGEVRRLSGRHEIGGHTLSHVRLHPSCKEMIYREVEGSYQWLSTVTGRAPQSFCFPGGVHPPAAVEAVYRAGYRLARTTELLRTRLPDGFALLPTTLQLYPHRPLTYVGHAAKRKRWSSLMAWIRIGSPSDLARMTEQYLEQVEGKGGCFHLWGHSWEIEEAGLWKKMEEVLRIMAQHPGIRPVSNGELIDYLNRNTTLQ